MLNTQYSSKIQEYLIAASFTKTCKMQYKLHFLLSIEN